MAPNTLQELERLGKSYYTVADLEKVFSLNRRSLLVALTRLKKRGQLLRLCRGIYQLPNRPSNAFAIATQIYQPSYVSFESAMASYGVISQIPYTVALATVNKPKRIVIGGTTCEYRHLKPDLFFGFTLENGAYIASPEKALLDQLYMVSKGMAGLDFDALDLKVIKKSVLRSMMQKYPLATRKLARSLLGQIGKSSISVK